MESLNQAQKEAVLYNEGPSLVIAGAGSGKTRVLTYKVAYLMQEIGLPPYAILALTFTNKAAREMKERIAAMVGEKEARMLAMGTFHSQFSHILRTEFEAVGISSNFTVYDTADSKNLIKTIIKEMSLDEKLYKPSLVLSRISSAKNRMILPDQYSAKEGNQDILMHVPRVKDVYAEYVRRCSQSSAIDFDDMLCLTIQLFAKHPEILAKYQNRFQFILVDEYQDTNYAQHLIIKALAAKHHRVCVVGDDSQSIYAFRGADISNILQFRETYPEAKLFKLEQNYRSTQLLVNAANSLIAKNEHRIPKTVYSENEAGKPISVIQAHSDIEEAEIVALRVKRFKMQPDAVWNDTAILYRTNAQSRVFEDCFRRHSIPYVVYGGKSFYQRKEIKDALSYLRLLVNSADEEAFMRSVNYPARGIGNTTLEKVKQVANTQRVSLFDVCADPLAFQLNVNTGTAKKLTNFTQMITLLSAQLAEKNAYEVAKDTIDQSTLLHVLRETHTPEAESAAQNIDELLNAIQSYCETKLEEDGKEARLADYLSEVALLTDADTDQDEDADRVTLMTVHASKGLEFKNIFVVGLEEELFPSLLSMKKESEIEEERRLMYVALTRAAATCCLTYATSRFRQGSTTYPSPSRFIKDIDSKYLHFENQPASTYDFSRRSESFFSQRTVSSLKDRASYSPTPSFTESNTYGERGIYGERSTYSERNSYGVRNTYPQRTSTVPTRGHFVPVNKAAGPSKLDPAIDAIQAGQWIEHNTFGMGQVTEVIPSPDGKRIKVAFQNAGQKTLLLKFAKIKIIS